MVVLWCPSAKRRNLAAHISNGNRLSLDGKAALFAFAKEERAKCLYGSLKRAMARCHAVGFPMSRKTAALWVDRWVANGWRFDAKERSRGQKRPRSVSDVGRRQLVKAARGSNARRVAREHTFTGRDGAKKKVSRMTVSRWAKKANLVLSQPKERRIRTHFAHHVRMRVAHCEWVVALPDDEVAGFCYSDEQGWPVTFGKNRKNDVIFVDRGLQATTNIIRRTKGDASTCFSMWWAIAESGVVAFELYEGTLTVAKFHQLLRDHLQPALADADSPITHFFHDHVTNSASLFDADVMNAAVGRGRWLQHAPKGCRVEAGHIWIAATDKRRGHQRRATAPAPVCECEVKTGDIVPSASPELNLAESAQGYLRQLVSDALRVGGQRWRGNVAHKMTIVRDVIIALDADKGYWKRLFASVKPRCQKVIDSGGALLTL